jgi:hypothetical protein
MGAIVTFVRRKVKNRLQQRSILVVTRVVLVHESAPRKKTFGAVGEAARALAASGE